MPESDANNEDLEWRDVTPLIEFGCWFTIALAPFLRWVNGPAVTQDQFVVQVGLVSLAIVGAVGLRFYHWLNRARRRF